MIVQLLLTICVLILFLALSFLFSGFETGIISIDQINLEYDARKNRSKGRLLRFIRTPDKCLGTTLLGNNVVNVLLSSISTYLIHSLRQSFAVIDPAWTSLIVGTIVLIFGEIMPKAIFRERPEILVPRFFPVIQVTYFLLRPIVSVVSGINRALRKLLKLADDDNFNYLTKDDLSLLLSEASHTGMSNPELEMIEDALDFNELDAKNVMVPRTEIIALPETATVEEALELAREEGFTRYPVYQGSIDNVVGILIIYDVFKKECTPQTLVGDLLHEPYFAPENTDLDVLLKEMQRLHRSMAIIVDSYGGTAGLVTIEDILEEIVGEIEDEYDEEEPSTEVVQISPNTWLVEADVDIDVLADDHDIILPEGDYETVAGLILDRLEQIPHQGQIINCDHFRIQVLQATDKKIIKVKIHKLTDKEVKQ